MALHGIQPQPVEAVVGQPVQRILDREGAHLRHAIIDRAAPGRLRFGEEGRRVAAEIISLGAEVIVDDVEKHHQPAQMRFVDQCLEILGAAIGAVGRIPQHAVIAPVAAAGEIGQRHQFQRGDAGRDEMIELVDHGAVGALAREGADMGFDQHRLFPGPPAPIVRAPCDRRRDRSPRSGRTRPPAGRRMRDRARRSRRRSGTCSGLPARSAGNLGGHTSHPRRRCIA